ncbi:hypothetical protein QE379_001097 [Sphingomonas sp. SORGH_AS 879]|nr:hypothetical protein [Sphingomonas sp. SORGH_AS_0879]
MVLGRLAFSSRFPYIRLRSTRVLQTRSDDKAPLREFIYLDEISLASLLASQKGEITDNITAKSEAALLAEIGGKISAKPIPGASAEVTSRLQSTNSSAIQTVRKANAQSLFRELHMLKNLRKIQPNNKGELPEKLDDLFSDPHTYSAFKASELNRGDLVEFHVQLSASWIFQMSTMIAEFSDMFDESPALFIENVKFSDLYNAKNANKIINRLLAGLVPIDGIASGYSVVIDGTDEYIVKNMVVDHLGLDSIPLKVVGVTEHSAYWKDIRRVLFANNEFTVLCRLSKAGLQTEWNPIKAADIFRDFVPDLAAQIEESSKMAMMASSENASKQSPDPSHSQLIFAIGKYKDILLSEIDDKITDVVLESIDERISQIVFYPDTAEGQRLAFAQVKALIEELTGQNVSPQIDFDARERSRKAMKLPFFPDISVSKAKEVTTIPVLLEPKKSRMLDVEVVAIYW